MIGFNYFINLIEILKNINEANGEINGINKINKIKFCIDFEFNGKDVGLMQLYITKINIVFLLNPENFTPENKKILIGDFKRYPHTFVESWKSLSRF